MRVRLATLALVLALWWMLSLGASELGFPGPVRVLTAFSELLTDGSLVGALSYTLSAFVVGAPLAVAIGVPLGVLMGVRPWLGLAVDPYLTALYVMPFSAWVPLLVLWFGIDELVRIVFIFLFTLPQVAIVCYQGPRSLPTTQVEVAQTFLASEWQVLRKVIIPHEIPFIFTALRLGVGLAIQGLVVSELLIASVRGLGIPHPDPQRDARPVERPRRRPVRDAAGHRGGLDHAADRELRDTLAPGNDDRARRIGWLTPARRSQSRA